MATTFLYVLPVHNEDWLKLGISNDPLRRAREFSDRFHEAFDLDRAVLVETGDRRDAAALERDLLDGWARSLMREYLLDPDDTTAGALPASLQRHLRDAVDAFHAFGLDVEDCLPPGLRAWYRGLPGLPEPDRG